MLYLGARAGLYQRVTVHMTVHVGAALWAWHTMRLSVLPAELPLGHGFSSLSALHCALPCLQSSGAWLATACRTAQRGRSSRRRPCSRRRSRRRSRQRQTLAQRPLEAARQRRRGPWVGQPQAPASATCWSIQSECPAAGDWLADWIVQLAWPVYLPPVWLDARGWPCWHRRSSAVAAPRFAAAVLGRLGLGAFIAKEVRAASMRCVHLRPPGAVPRARPRQPSLAT